MEGGGCGVDLEAVHEHFTEGGGVLVEGCEALRQDRNGWEERGGDAERDGQRLVHG